MDQVFLVAYDMFIETLIEQCKCDVPDRGDRASKMCASLYYYGHNDRYNNVWG